MRTTSALAVAGHRIVACARVMSEQLIAVWLHCNEPRRKSAWRLGELGIVMSAFEGVADRHDVVAYSRRWNISSFAVSTKSRSGVERCARLGKYRKYPGTVGA